MKLPTVVVLALISVLAAACDLGGPGVDLDGAWTLQRGTVDGGALQLVPGAQLSLRIEGSEVGGIAACNHYGGEMSRDGGRITMSALSMTEMGCPEPIMALEAAYLGALSRVEAAARSGDQLRLTGPGTELDYTLQPPVADADPVGTRWQLESLISGDAVSSVAGDATLALAADGTVSGSTGCRSFSGTYALAGDELTVEGLIVDMRPCDADTAAQDGQVLRVLEGPMRLAVDGDRLTLMLGSEGLDYRAIGG